MRLELEGLTLVEQKRQLAKYLVVCGLTGLCITFAVLWWAAYSKSQDASYIGFIFSMDIMLLVFDIWPTAVKLFKLQHQQ